MKEKCQKKNTTTKTEKKKGDKSYSKRVRAKWFCCEFKLGFLKLISNASLIFTSNLELALSIILQENYMSQSMLWWSIDV